MVARPLDGVRVLDLTRLLPGGVATMLLADMGADILKIEDPFGGDYARQMPPLVNGEGAVFNATNRGKRSLILNLKHADGPVVLTRLAASADVLIESFRPGTLAKFGCDADALRAVNPRLIYCSLSGWGVDGPRVQQAGHDLNFAAASGVIGAMGQPQPLGGQIADIGGAYSAVIAILAALLRRAATGVGGFADISLAEGALPFGLYGWVEAAVTKTAGQGELTGGLACYNVYSASDGVPVALAALEEKFWLRFCAAVERPEWRGYHGQPAAQPMLIAMLRDLFATRTAAAWDALLTPADCCFTVVQSPHTLHENAHFAARESVRLDADGIPVLRSPARLDGQTMPVCPVPRYGQHTREALMEYGFAEAEIIELLEKSCIKVG